MSIVLRDGSQTADPRLNRLIEFDERSRQFPIREVLPSVGLRSRTWRAGAVLNQQSEGACVGMALAKDAMSEPTPVTGVNEKTALGLYRMAQKLDEWPDDIPYEGTSTLGGIKAYRKQGFIGAYRWAFNIDDVLSTLSNVGPVVIGVWWYESMYETRANGLVEIAGEKVGGHCICLTGHWLRKRFVNEYRPRHVVEWTNSWGYEYGVNGRGYITPESLEALLDDDGEACVPVDRKYPKVIAH